MANAILQKAGTPVVWQDSGGDLAMTLQNLAFGAGRQGAVKDWGALSTARATKYHWRFVCSFETPPALGEIVSIFWKGGDGTNYDNDDGTGDIALSSSDKLRNATYLGQVIVDEAAQDIKISVSGVFENFDRYGQPVIINLSAGDNLQNIANDASFTVTPIYDELQ